MRVNHTTKVFLAFLGMKGTHQPTKPWVKEFFKNMLDNYV